MTTIFIDETAAGSLDLLLELAKTAQTATIETGVYQVSAPTDVVEAVTTKYPLVVLKVVEV
jgi:hypothetical protein